MAQGNKPNGAAGGVLMARVDREIVISRVFDAERTLVFEAWTEASHVEHWWGPKGFSTRVAEMEVRPGGVAVHAVHHDRTGRHRVSGRGRLSRDRAA